MLAVKMKHRFTVAAILLAFLLVIGSANIAQAQWDALSSGYAVTTNWHGEDVPIGQSITAWAGTTDSLADGVEFRWLDPSGNLAVIPAPRVLVSVLGPYVTPSVPSGAPQEIVDWAIKYPGQTVWYATNTQGPDVLNILGDWGVQANFYDSDNPVKTLRGRNSDIIKIRATSFNVVPEVPFGTIVILLSMFGALGVFATKKKHNLLHGAPS
jgi:hypothetical protein